MRCIRLSGDQKMSNDNHWSYFYCRSCKQYFSRYCSTKNCIHCGSKLIIKLTEKVIIQVTGTQHKALRNKARK